VGGDEEADLTEGNAVIARAGGQPVVTCATDQKVVADIAVELVALRASRQPVCASAAVDDVVAAGALPLVGLTALQALRAAGTGPGDTVLVHAASGGVGHLAVQVARELGATRVLGTSSERNADFVRSLGADPVTYGPGLGDRVAELVGGDGRVDVAVDFIGGEALAASPALVRDPARHVSVVDPAPVLEQGGRYVFVRPDAEGLGWLAERVADGRIIVEIQQVFDLAAAPDAHRLLEEGHVRGKLVLGGSSCVVSAVCGSRAVASPAC